MMARTARQLRLSNIPDVSAVGGGDAPFFAYCAGGEVRARQRRDAINRAHAEHQRRLRSGGDPYPTALVLGQRAGVAIEDVARLSLAFSALGKSDPFDALRSAKGPLLDDVWARLASDPERFRTVFRLPSPEDTIDVAEPLRSSLLELSDALAARWLRLWAEAAEGWQLLRRLAKGMRHGAPLLPRELVIGPPGAGALGQGLQDRFERWVLVMETSVDHAERSSETTYAAADLGDDTLARARQAALGAVALGRDVSAGHVHRLRTGSRWVMPNDALRLVDVKHRQVLREHQIG